MQVAPFIQPVLQNVLEHIGAMETGDSATPDEWRRWVAHWDVDSSAEPSDTYVTTWDIVNITNGNIDSTWNDADYGVVYTYLSALCISWTARMQVGVTFRELRAYRMSFRPVTDPKPFFTSGPPEKAYAFSTPGDETSFQAPQIAYTTTDLTPYRRHWGRNYWPAPGAGFQLAGGHILSTFVDGWLQEVHDAYNNLMVNEFFPVVAVTQVGKVPTRGLLTLQGVQMDDVPDVIRRRRPENPTHKAVQPLTALTLPAP